MSPATLAPIKNKPDDLIEFDMRLGRKAGRFLLVDTPKYVVMLAPERKYPYPDQRSFRIRVALVDYLNGDKMGKPGWTRHGAPRHR